MKILKRIVRYGLTFSITSNPPTLHIYIMLKLITISIKFAR